MNIFQVLKELGYEKVDPSPYTKMDVWRSWYVGDVEDFHKYKVFNGTAYVETRRYTTGMAKKVCEDWASLLLNEKVAITLEGEKEQTFVDDVLNNANFRIKGSELQEQTAALGTGAIVPRITGATSGADGTVSGGAIKLDYVRAEKIFPLTWENGIITECAFSSSRNLSNDKKKYTYVQIHHLVDGKYDIDNLLFLDSNGNLEPVGLDTVDGFQNIPPVIHTQSDKPQYVIDRYNITNNADMDSPMGISVFANAIDQLKGVDIAYDSYVNEFILGKKRIFVMPEFTKTVDGKPVFDPNDTVYYVMPGDGEGTGVQQVDMTLRTTEHNSGIQDMLNVLSAKVGFGENHYQFDRGSITTATQIISENSSLYRTIKKHEIILEKMLIDLCRIILRLGNQYLNAGLNEDVEISVDFDDSIIEDKATERQQDRQDVAMGAMNMYEYRMKWYNEDEETAKKALPKMEALISE